MKKNTILIVDDSDINRSLLSSMLEDEYNIIEARDGVEAVAKIRTCKNELSLVLLDIVMPKMDGFEVLSVMYKNKWLDNIPVIIISAETSSSYINHAYDLGVAEYISRPFDEKTIKRRVRNIIVLYTKQKQLENAVVGQMLEKKKNDLMMVEILSHIVEFRNGESGLHVLHIRVMTEILLDRLAQMTDKYDLPPAKIALISNASVLHDIGKISIPEEILNKPGKLTPEEYEIMKTHSAVGAQMIESVSYYKKEELTRMARDICRWHHERYDGKGYPDGLKGEEIPIAAQAVSLADVYDALTSERVYKSAFSHEKAMEMILNGECGAFNPLLLECLQYCSPRLKEEMHVRSVGDISKDGIKTITKSLLQNGGVPNPTLNLLEQERVKYQFFTSLSRELEFEYEYDTDILTICQWAAEKLGLDPVIVNPWENRNILEIMPKENIDHFAGLIKEATPGQPIVSYNYFLNFKGIAGDYQLIARPLWGHGESSEITGIIGKFMGVDQLK